MDSQEVLERLHRIKDEMAEIAKFIYERPTGLLITEADDITAVACDITNDVVSVAVNAQSYRVIEPKSTQN